MALKFAKTPVTHGLFTIALVEGVLFLDGTDTLVTLRLEGPDGIDLAAAFFENCGRVGMTVRPGRYTVKVWRGRVEYADFDRAAAIMTVHLEVIEDAKPARFRLVNQSEHVPGLELGLLEDPGEGYFFVVLQKLGRSNLYVDLLTPAAGGEAVLDEVGGTLRVQGGIGRCILKVWRKERPRGNPDHIVTFDIERT